MVLSEDILKIKYRKEPFDIFEIEKGTLLTPSAKQFLNEKGIELVIKGEKPLVSTKNEEDNLEAEEKIFYRKYCRHFIISNIYTVYSNIYFFTIISFKNCM